MSGVELPAVIVAPSPLPNTGLSLASFSTEESGRRFWSRVRPEVGRDQVVEEAAVVGGGEVLVARGGELVLRLAADRPTRAAVMRGVLAHRQAGARLGVARDLGHELARPQPGERLEPRARRSWRG